MNTRIAIIGIIVLIVIALSLIGLVLLGLIHPRVISSPIPAPISHTGSTPGVIKPDSLLEIRGCVLRQGNRTKVRLIFHNKGKWSIKNLKILKATLGTKSPNKVTLTYHIAKLAPIQRHQVEWEFSGVSSKLELEGEYKIAPFGLSLGEGSFSLSASLTPCRP